MNRTHRPECREILEGISAYLDDELDAPACAAIERHCQACDSCADLVDGLKTTVGLCRKAAGVALPDDIRDRARRAVRQLLDSHRSRG